MPISNYPNGFMNGVAIQGVPILNTYGGNVFWLDNTNGADTGKGTHNQPWKTLDYAVGRCTANNGDILIIKAGHAETVATAGAIAIDVAGITIIGLGSGADRPTFTFSAVDATMTISAASTNLQNILIKPSIDSVVSPIVVSAADCTIDVEVQDASAAVECVTAVLTTADADRLDLNLKYRGFLAGNACVSPIRLVGVDTARVNVDFYGVASTAIVEFHTTACHDIVVTGKFYNNGTSLTKNIVDTVTGSTWHASGWDGNSNSNFSGGDNAALAGDDIGAATAAIATAQADLNILTGATGANLLTATQASIDAIEVDTSTTIPAAITTAQNDLDILTGATGANLLAATQASIDAIEVDTSTTLPATLAAGIPQIAIKATGDLTAFGTSLTLFTVTGDVLVKVGASVDVAVTCTSATSTLEVGVAGNTACLCIQDAVDGTAFDIGDSWSLVTAADANGAGMAAEWVLVGNGVDIILTSSVDDITAGDIDFYCQFIPLSADGDVVAA